MLIDRILKLYEHSQGKLTKIEKNLIGLLRQAEVILADNVAEYLYSETPQENWDLSRDFPNIAPPFPTMFIEYSMPKFVLSEVYGKFEVQNPVKKCGVLILSAEIDSFPPITDLAEVKDIPSELNRDMLNEYLRLRDDLINRLNEKGYRWISRAYEFCETKENMISAFPREITWFVTHDGRIGGDPLIGMLNSDFLEATGNPRLSIEDIKNTASLHVPFLALSFMHCTNVEVITVPPAAKLNRARIKRGKLPLVVHKILDVRPVRKILEKDGNAQQVGIQKALHICRGHFKDYSIGKGLFGRVHGMFWWDMFIRGDSNRGRVVKDYSIYTE